MGKYFTYTIKNKEFNINKIHNLKIKLTYYLDVSCGNKTFELRKNDRDFKVGDYIHFIDTNGEEFKFEKNNLYRITYILKDVEEYGLNKDYAILGIKYIGV